MRLPQELVGEPLKWVRARGLKERFELRVGAAETTIASLTMRSLSDWQADIGGAVLRFTRSGLLGQQVTVRMGDDETPVAEYRGSGDRGAVEVIGGSVYRWRKPRFWTNERDWLDTAERPIIRMQPANWRATVRVRCAPAAYETSDFALLIILGELLLAAAQQDAAIIAATTVTLGGA